MSESVKIIVEQETRGTALQDALRDAEELKKQGTSAGGHPWSEEVARQYPETVRRIQELNRTAAAEEGTGGSGDGAQAARAESRALQAELLRATREQRQLEREITEEQRAQNALTGAAATARTGRIPLQLGAREAADAAPESRIAPPATAAPTRRLAEREYRSLISPVGPRGPIGPMGLMPAGAAPAARATVSPESQPDTPGSYARLVHARSGAGDIARAASLAAGQREGGGHLTGVVEAIRTLHAAVVRQHQEALNAHPHRL